MDTPFVKAQHYFGQAEKMRELGAAEEDAASRTAYYKQPKATKDLPEERQQAKKSES